MKPTDAHMDEVAKWRVRGLYSEACNCEAVCPCYSHDDPTYGYCEGPCIWHVKQGTYGDIVLDGLTVVMVQHCAGHMERTKWKCWFYIDNQANDEQFHALQQIFTAKAGGYIGRIYSRLWDIVSVERAPIEIDVKGWEQRVSIRGKLELLIKNIKLEKGPVMCFLPNVHGVSALADDDRFDNGQIKFDHTNKNAMSTTFSYKSDK